MTKPTKVTTLTTTTTTMSKARKEVTSNGRKVKKGRRRLPGSPGPGQATLDGWLTRREQWKGKGELEESTDDNSRDHTTRPGPGGAKRPRQAVEAYDS